MFFRMLRYEITLTCPGEEIIINLISKYPWQLKIILLFIISSSGLTSQDVIEWKKKVSNQQNVSLKRGFWNGTLKVKE